MAPTEAVTLGFAAWFLRIYLNRRYPQSPEAAKSRGLVFNPDHQMVIAKKLGQVESEWNMRWLTGVIAPQRLFFMINSLGIVAQIISGIEMAQSIQKTLSVIDRNALLHLTLFLTPFAEIFAFLEDIMSVRVQYALAAGRNGEVGKLIKWGFWGGLACGSVAAGLITVFAYVPSIFEFLVLPEESKDALLYPNCSSSLLPTAAEQIAESRSVWLLSAWELPGQFALGTLFGFLGGTFELTILSMATTISEVSTLPIWFLEKQSYPNKLELLGIAGFVGSYLAIGFVLVYVFCTKRMRTQYRMHLFGAGPGAGGDGAAPPSTAVASTKAGAIAEDEAGEVAAADPTLAELFKEGGQMMIVDLGLQLPKLVAVYAAAIAAGTAVVYQLSVAMTLMSTIGPPFLVFPLMFLSTYGPQLLAKRFYSAFRVFAYGSLAIAAAIGVASSAVVLADPAAYGDSFGANACAYAGTGGCSGVYSDIFTGGGGGFSSSLEATLRAWAVVVVFECVLRVLRKCMVAQCDFRFMAASSALCFLFGFVPAIAVVCVYYPTRAYCYLLAMYVPHMLMCVIFAGRFYSNMQRMMAGAPGPWSVHAMSTAQVAMGKAGRRSTLADQLNKIIGVGGDLENPASLGQSAASTARVEPAPAVRSDSPAGEESRASAVYASDWDRYFLSPTGGGRCFMWIPIISLPFWCWYNFLRPCFFTQPAKTDTNRDMEEGGEGVSDQSANYTAAGSP